MNKTAIKNFAVWARNKLIADITYKAGLIGVSDKGIAAPLPQSSDDLQFFDIGTKEYAQVTGKKINQRNALVRAIQEKEHDNAYATAFQAVIEEVAYTWFNRLIAIRFMEVNDYLPSRVRVLSSENPAKNEPDFVTTPFDTDMEFTTAEQDTIMRLKEENKLDDLFRMLFIKQCSKLHEILPKLFENTSDYTEMLLSISFTDRDGIVYHLVHDIDEDDFNVEKEGQVEIIGWLYQYYNIEPKDETFALLKKNVKITKERIPAATQLFTPDWIVRYMVENSLGRLWVEGHPNDKVNFTEDEREGGLGRGLKSNWKYYLEEAEQEADVQVQLEKIHEEYRNLNPEDIKVIDPCMGSGHILVYCFDVLMQIYESQGYTQRDAAQSILKNNLFGLDIDKRAAQLAYFAVMMKARQYDRRIFGREIKPQVYAIRESNGIDRYTFDYFCNGDEKLKKSMKILMDDLHDAKEYGSILQVTQVDFSVLYARFDEIQEEIHLGRQAALEKLPPLVQCAEVMAQKYHVVVTNPPYMGASGMGRKLSDFVKKKYPDSKSDLFSVFIERCGEMTVKNGYQAMITQHAWMFLSSFEKLRVKMFLKDLINMAHLGARAFDEIGGEVVQTTSFVMRKSYLNGYSGKYQRLIDGRSEAEKEEMFCDGTHLYTAAQCEFGKIPGSPVAYWVKTPMFSLFEIYPALSNCVQFCKGIATMDNNRFLKLWFEVAFDNLKVNAENSDKALSSKCKWFAYNKGGNYRRWYGNRDYVINWYEDGKELKDNVVRVYGGGSYTKEVRSESKYFREGMTWSTLSSGLISFRFSPVGALFDSKGSMGFVDDSELIYFIVGLLNSCVVQYFMNILSPTIDYNITSLNAIPYVDSLSNGNVKCLVKENINLSRTDWDSFETSWDFANHPMVRSFSTVSEAYTAWQCECEERFLQLKANEEELNRIFIEIYGLQEELTPEVEDKDVTVRRFFESKESIPESMRGSNYALTKADAVKSLISYAVGCMFGRYSLEKEGLAYAGGDFEDIFHKKNVCLSDSEGNNLLTSDGTALVTEQEYYGEIKQEDGSWTALSFYPDEDNCIPITDEAYFEDDIVGLLCAWLKKVYGEDTLEENLDFMAKALGKKGSTSCEVIRNYFLTDFIKDHIKTYQKRPIYWLFDSGRQNGFKALVYMHRWDADTVGNLRVEYLHKTQRIYEREIQRMQETIDHSHDSREINRANKRKEKLQKQLKETKDYDTKLAHIALSRIDIDLDDGVKVNYEKVQTGRDGMKMQILTKI